ncbi:hypothetical protein BC941DRAFT_514096 [Chlamydoabsidia padenii]|nr:hypothetical protein BC941DRAFT_514096 [Chlamydoabsidia padenii]
METITNRLKPTTTDELPEEDQTEFLDEQEQESLLQDLRKQNEQSNLLIQCGLLFIGVLVSAIFIVYLYEIQTTAILPFPFLSTPIVSQIKYPHLGILLSILSIMVSMLNLMLTCRVTPSDIIRMTPSHRGMGRLDLGTGIGSAVTGSIMPLACLVNDKVVWMEVVFWSLPLMMLTMDLLAITMMGQVEANFTELEKSRYKYKGA